MALDQVHLLEVGGHNLEAYGVMCVLVEGGQGAEVCEDLGSVFQGVHSQERLGGQENVLVGVCKGHRLEIK